LLGLKGFVLSKFPRVSIQLFALKRLLEDSKVLSRKSLSMMISPEPLETQSTKQDTNKLLIIVPQEQSVDGSFGPALGNYHFELFKSYEEVFGEGNVSVYFIDSSKSFELHVSEILHVILKSKIDRVLFHIEGLDFRKGIWRWDLLAIGLNSIDRPVKAIGYMTDGAYPLHQLFCHRFLKIYPDSCFVQIDRKPDYLYLPAEKLLGPTFLPISNASLEILVKDAALNGQRGKTELSFIGKVYGYRASELAVLTDAGIRVSINPQSSESIGKRSSYIGYFRALFDSRFTLNFSRANGVSKPQLKSRMLEARLAGCIPITDNRDLNSIFFKEGRDYIFFESQDEISGGIRAWTEEEGIDWFSTKRFAEIRNLAQRSFWDLITKTAESRLD
jgi:hypothetical protein